MKIDTGDSHPMKQRMRRVPFALRQEIAQQLRDMQNGGIINRPSQPSGLNEEARWDPPFLCRLMEVECRHQTHYPELRTS